LHGNFDTLCDLHAVLEGEIILISTEIVEWLVVRSLQRRVATVELLVAVEQVRHDGGRLHLIGACLVPCRQRLYLRIHVRACRRHCGLAGGSLARRGRCGSPASEVLATVKFYQLLKTMTTQAVLGQDVCGILFAVDLA
jgi:hypothetical protein